MMHNQTLVWETLASFNKWNVLTDIDFCWEIFCLYSACLQHREICLMMICRVIDPELFVMEICVSVCVEARGSICLCLRADYIFIASFYKRFHCSEAWTLARIVPAGFCCAETLSTQEGEFSSCWFSKTFSIRGVMVLLLCGVKSLNL